MNPTVQRPAKTCEHCGGFYRPIQRYRTSRFCSRSCSAASRPRAFYVSLGRKRRKDPLVWGKRERAAYGQRKWREGYSEGLTAGYDAAVRDLRGVA